MPNAHFNAFFCSVPRLFEHKLKTEIASRLKFALVRCFVGKSYQSLQGKPVTHFLFA